MSDILDLIDNALADTTGPDAMRWAPVEAVTASEAIGAAHRSLVDSDAPASMRFIGGPLDGRWVPVSADLPGVIFMNVPRRVEIRWTPGEIISPIAPIDYDTVTYRLCTWANEYGRTVRCFYATEDVVTEDVLRAFRQG